jgi:flagellar assembly protein FliH
MATSSDWLTALGSPAPAPVPHWFEPLGFDGRLSEAAAQAGGFRAGAPFAAAPLPSPPSAQAPQAASGTAPPPAHPDQTSDLLREAEARAFAKGEAAGRAAARAEACQDMARARALRLHFRALDEAALSVLAAELAATVEALCGQVLGDYALDGAALAERCKVAAARLGSGWTGAVLHLHPDDVAALPDGALAGWTIASDPAMDRGALVIEGADGAVRDTPADWRRALAQALRV